MLKDTLAADLKTAMLARETEKVDTLKGIKSAVLYVELDTGKRDSGLTDEEILVVLKKESKKRQDSIDLYVQGGNEELADKERREKLIVDAYLPEQLDETAVNALIDQILEDLNISDPTKQDMGKIMGTAKSKGGAELDGSMLAKLVNARING